MMINLYIIYYIWNKKQVIELTINKIWKWWRSIEQENKGMVSNMKNRRKKLSKSTDLSLNFFRFGGKSNKSNFVNVTSILINI